MSENRVLVDPESESARRWKRRAAGLGPELLAGLSAIVTASFVAGRSLGAGFPVDDAWIHMVYGLAVRRGEGFAYNTGTAATGCTSPLWVLFAALAHLLSGSRAPSFAASTCLKGLGVLFFAVASVLGARLARLCAPRRSREAVAALAGGGLIACAPILAYAAVSGMEVAMTSALMLGALVLAGNKRVKLSALVAGVAALARPEAVLTLPLVLALGALHPGEAQRGTRARAWRLLAAAAIGAAPITAFLLRNLAASGQPLPATFYRKTRLRVDILFEDLDAGFRTVLSALAPASFLLLWALVATAILFGVLALSQRATHPRGRIPPRRMLAGATATLGVGYVAGVSMLMRLKGGGIFYFERYVLPPLPLLIVGAVSAAMWAGEARLSELPSPRVRALLRRALRVLTVGVFVLGFAAEASGMPELRVRYARDIADIEGLQVALGERMHALPPGAVVWSQDAGAIRYFGEHPTVDLNELNTPELFGGAGDRIPEAWWPDAVIVSLGAFRVEARDGVLDDVRVVAPSDPGNVLGEQHMYRCREGDAVVAVFRHGRRVAVGQCARR